MAKSSELTFALLDSNLQQAKILAERGATAGDFSPKERWNYLHLALITPHRAPDAAVIAWLIEWGVDVNGVDMYGSTPLHYAVVCKDPDRANMVAITSALIDAGSNLERLDVGNCTPLRRAINTGPIYHDIIRLLLQAGANMHQQNKPGASILELVRMRTKTDPELVQLFEQFASRAGPTSR